MQYRYHIKRISWLGRFFLGYLSLFLFNVLIDVFILGATFSYIWQAGILGIIFIILCNYFSKPKSEEYFLEVNDHQITYTDYFFGKRKRIIQVKEITHLERMENLSIYTANKEYAISSKYFNEVDREQIVREIQGLITKKC